MEGRMEINRLEKDELSYELGFRGITDKKNVEEMRITLRHILKLEKSGTLVYPTYPFSFADDREYLQRKLTELRTLVHDFADTETSGSFSKIKSKLLHCFKRAERATSDKDDENKIRSQILLEIVTLESDLRSRARRFKRASQLAATPLEISAILSSTNIANSSGSESDSDEASGAPVVNASASRIPTTSSQFIKSTPVSKWNISRFDGDSNKVSLNAFLENVEELRLSRNVTPEQLFSSASDLFMGKALIWFRSIRAEVHNWSELIDYLRLQFLPADYNDKLIDEIKNRTQGPNETIGMYIAIMTNMFNRLTVHISEAAKLKILMKNIAPFYQSHLGLVKVDSVKQLLDLGRQLESRKESIEAFTPPPRNPKNLMEPDLAYIYAPSSVSAPTDLETDIAACWICNKGNHRAAECPSKSERQYCFKCGNPGFTVRTCTKCNSNNSRQNSGNSRGGR